MAQARNIPLDKDDWYIAIMRGGGIYSSFVGSGSKYYRDWRENTKKYRLEVVAEEFGISDEVVNHLEGWNIEGRHKLMGDDPLRKLVDRLNSGQNFDIQKALDRLCE